MGKEGQQETLNNKQGIKLILEKDDVISMVIWCNGDMEQHI